MEGASDLQQARQSGKETIVNKPSCCKTGLFQETAYRDGRIAEKDLKEEQVAALDPHEVDFF